MLFHVLTVHNLTLSAWRTRAGSSPGYPSLHRVITGQTPPRLPPDETGVAVSLSSHPGRALTLSGEEMHKCQALPRTAPSHPTSPPGKETQVTELGRSHNCTLTSASRGPDLPRDTMGHTPLILPNIKNCLKPTGTTVQWCAWPYFCWECFSLPPSSIPPRLSDVSFSAVSNTDNKLLEAGICREQYSSSATGLAGHTKKWSRANDQPLKQT